MKFSKRYKFLQDPQWSDLDEKGHFRLSPDAPAEVVASYQEYLKDREEAERSAQAEIEQEINDQRAAKLFGVE